MPSYPLPPEIKNFDPGRSTRKFLKSSISPSPNWFSSGEKQNLQRRFAPLHLFSRNSFQIGCVLVAGLRTGDPVWAMPVLLNSRIISTINDEEATHNPKVEGSNPSPATNKFKGLGIMSLTIFCFHLTTRFFKTQNTDH